MINELKKYLQEISDTFALDGSISSSEAEKKASVYLEVMAKITDARHVLSEQKIKLTTITTATFSEILSTKTGKTVTENKTSTEADPVYTDVRESLERIENDLAYLKAYYDITQNAHIFYRQVSKGDQF